MITYDQYLLVYNSAITYPDTTLAVGAFIFAGALQWAQYGLEKMFTKKLTGRIVKPSEVEQILSEN